jgi:hypothetical protein
MPENTIDPRLEEIERLYTKAFMAKEYFARLKEQIKKLLHEPGGHELVLGHGSEGLIRYILLPYEGLVGEIGPEGYDIIMSRPDASDFCRFLKAKDLTPNQVSKLLAIAPSDELPDVISRHGGKFSRADWQYVFSKTPDKGYRIERLMRNLPRSDHPEYEAIAGDAIDHFLASGRPYRSYNLSLFIREVVKTAPKEFRAKLMDRLLRDHADLDYTELIRGRDTIELEPRHIDHFLRDPKIRGWILKKQPLTEEQIHGVLANPDVSVEDAEGLLSNHKIKLSEQQQHRLLDLGLKWPVIELGLDHAAPSVRRRLLSDPGNFYYFTQRTKLSDEEALHIFHNIDKAPAFGKRGALEKVLGTFAQSSDPKLIGIAAAESEKRNDVSWLDEQLIENSHLPREVAFSLANAWLRRPKTLSHKFVAKLLDHPNFHEDDIKTLLPWAETHPNTLGRVINKRLATIDPDSHHKESVGVKLYGSKRFALGQLRKLRDLASSKGGVLTRKELGQNVPEPIIRAKLLDTKGNLSAAKVQAFIDSLPETRFNVSHSNWGKGKVQRHSETQPNKVFRVNLTNDHVRQLKEAGVWQTYLKMNRVSKQSGHPVTDFTLGWVRWSGNKNGNVFIDEVQSDFAQSFVKKAIAQAKKNGLDPEEAAKRAEQEWPEKNYKAIRKILFQDQHPNEIIHQAFEQYLRDNGYIGKLVHMWETQGKRTISLEDDSEPVPGHMAETYHDIPTKHGYEPATYGELKIQDNPEHHGKPTLKTTLRKAEGTAQPDFLYYYGKRPDLGATPPMAECWFSGAEVDPFATTPYRYVVQVPNGPLYNLDEDKYHLLEPHWEIEYGKFAYHRHPTMEEVVKKLREGGFVGHFGHHAIYPGAVTLYEPAGLLMPEPDRPLLQRHLEKSERLDPRVATAAIQKALRDESAPQESAVAAEALWYLLGGADSEYVPMTGFHEGQPHWWLAKREDPQAILDPAVLRFESLPDYSQGRPASFLSEGAASPRARTLLDAIQAPKPLAKSDFFDTPEFQAWFQGSKVVDGNGRPLILYHGTTAPDFSTFDDGNDLIHFGTESQANRRLSGTSRRFDVFNDTARGLAAWAVRDLLTGETVNVYYGRNAWDSGAFQDASRRNAESRVKGDYFDPGSRVIPVVLSVKNPIRLPDVFSRVDISLPKAALIIGRAANFDDNTTNKLIRIGRKHERAYGRLNLEADDHQREFWREAKEALQAKGYDGVVYANDVEGDGDSWAVFHPTQIKSATGNQGTWDPKNPDITKFEQELAEFKKAIDPTHLSDLFTIDKLARKDDANDLHVVDHTPHLAINLPHIDRIRDFQENILEAPAVISPFNAKIPGAFEKRLFRSPATQYKYLVKPYHDRLFMGYRHGFDVGQGWSEMVNQALYHAGGIGHLHGLNHATEYDLGGGNILPLLVSSFDTVLTDHVERLRDNKFAEQFDRHALGQQAARIAMMDYLSDNTDRHEQNWLVGLDPDGSSRLLAIDHSFCYQYHRYHGKLFGFFENAIKQIDNTQQTDWNSHAREAAKWWLGAKDAIAKEFNNHLGLIRRPAVRDRIKNEFERRHGILSRWAEEAVTTPNPYLPLVMAKQDW